MTNAGRYLRNIGETEAGFKSKTVSLRHPSAAPIRRGQIGRKGIEREVRRWAFSPQKIGGVAEVLGEDLDGFTQSAPGFPGGGVRARSGAALGVLGLVVGAAFLYGPGARACGW